MTEPLSICTCRMCGHGRMRMCAHTCDASKSVTVTGWSSASFCHKIYFSLCVIPLLALRWYTTKTTSHYNSQHGCRVLSMPHRHSSLRSSREQPMTCQIWDVFCWSTDTQIKASSSLLTMCVVCKTMSYNTMIYRMSTVPVTCIKLLKFFLIRA